MWANFAGKNFDTAAQFEARIAAVTWSPGRWLPSGITIHNTAGPTLAQWVESGPSHDARIANLQSYYERADPSTHKVPWHAGPHFFVSRSHVSGFSDPLAPGVHASCFNQTHIGIELVGDFDKENPNAPGSDAAAVYQMGVIAAAALCRRLDLDPRKAVNFHQDCKADNHACPGHLFRRSLFVLEVTSRMALAAVVGRPVVPTPPPAAKEPWEALDWPISSRGNYRMAWIQDTLNRLNGDRVQITVDGLKGPMTEMAVRHFQHDQNIAIDGDVGEETMAALKQALAAAGAH